MATPVPYDIGRGGAASFEPIPSVNVQASPNAFGVNIGEAIQHLGAVQEGAGRELFDRAYAMQELDQHAKANAGIADAQNKMLDSYLQYSQLEGKQATDAYPAYQKGLDQIRDSVGATMPSPYAKFLFDQESRQSSFRMKWYGGEQAARENKRYIVGSADARIDAATKEMQAAPNDQATTEASLATIREQVKNKFGDIGGMSPEEVKQKQNDAVNTAVNGRVRALAKDDPIGAQKLLDRAVKDGDLYGNDLTNLSWYVRNQRDNIGSRTTAQQVLEDGRNDGGPVLRALFRNESGGQDVVNTHQGTSSGQAQGFFQITTGTWREFADKAGVDLREYPQAHGTPYSVQAQVANIIPLGRWDQSTIKAMLAAGGKLDLTKTLGQNLAANGEGLGKGVTPEPTLADLIQRGRAIAQQQFHDDIGYQDMVEAKIIAQYDKELAIRRDTDFHNEQAISGALIGGVGPDQKIPTTVEELKLDPKASAAWDQMEANHPTELQKFLNQMRMNAKGDVALTPERLETWHRLYTDAAQSPDVFMKETQDLSALDLPKAQKLDIIRMQGEIYKKMDAAPQLNHALSLLSRTGMFSSAGLEPQDDNYKLFGGVLQDVMTQYQLDNGKPMPDEEIKKVGTQLLGNVPTRGMFGGLFGPGKQPWFESKSFDEVPPDVAENIRRDPRWGGAQPSDQQVLQTFLAAQYQGLYGKGGTKNPALPEYELNILPSKFREQFYGGGR